MQKQRVTRIDCDVYSALHLTLALGFLNSIFQSTLYFHGLY
jgi:hypothetical protein